MTTIIADIETDGLNATKVWQISLTYFNHHTQSFEDVQSFGPNEIPRALELLSERGAHLVLHNGINFDLPVLQRLFDLQFDRSRVIDTLVLSRLAKVDRPGGHSLKAWGERVGIDKPEHTEWDRWSPEMAKRCDDDVRITVEVYKKLSPMLTKWRDAVELEHKVAWIMQDAMERGVHLDVKHTTKLLGVLLSEQEELEAEFQLWFPPIVEERYSSKTGKRLKDSVTVFNPKSTQQIADRLQKLGWIPEVFTNTGLPQITGDVLRTSKLKEAHVLADYLDRKKLIEQINSEPKKDGSGGGWLHHVDGDSRVHPKFNTIGTNTHRMSCSSPNLQQVHSDSRARSCWTATPGFVMVGADLEGIEMRILAELLSTYDDGVFIKEVLDGDIHTKVMKGIGFDISDDPDVIKNVCRQNTKRVEYAAIFGAGNPKLGEIAVQNWLQCGKTLNAKEYGAKQNNLKSVGAEIRRRMASSIPGWDALKEAIDMEAATGLIRGLDDRKLWVRNQHSALNLKIQHYGAVIAKRALVIAEHLLSRKLQVDRDYRLVLQVHDEYQYEVRPEFADMVGRTIVEACNEAGKYYDFNIRIDAGYKVGPSWKHTH